MQILKNIRQTNIVRLFEYFETDKLILFVTEVATGGDLINYVRKRRSLNEESAKSIFKQLIQGLRHCHSKGVLHRDIKLDNILLTVEGVVKICDFGVAKSNMVKGEILTEQCGTPAYMAPEVINGKGYEGFASDIWSAGVVLYSILQGMVPFKSDNIKDL